MGTDSLSDRDLVVAGEKTKKDLTRCEHNLEIKIVQSDDAL